MNKKERIDALMNLISGSHKDNAKYIKVIEMNEDGKIITTINIPGSENLTVIGPAGIAEKIQLII